MSCCGCLETPSRVTNLYRHEELLYKFTDLTGLSVRHENHQMQENIKICNFRLLEILSSATAAQLSWKPRLLSKRNASKFTRRK